MLRAHVQDELLDLALFDLDRRERVIGRVRRRAPRKPTPPLDVGGGYPYPPFMILINLSAPPRDTLRAGGVRSSRMNRSSLTLSALHDLFAKPQ